MSELVAVAPLPFAVFVTVFGACIGSFLNVCIYRIPEEQSIIWPPSNCPRCHHRIAWYDNIPVLSYLILRGHCRHCRASFSPRYALVEALTAVLFLLIWQAHGWTVITPLYMLAAAGLILATFVDFDHMIIPDRVSIGGMVIGLAVSAGFPALHGETAALPALKDAAIGLATGAGTLGLVAVLGKMAFRKDAMGMGDIKLLGAIGAFFGWEGVLFTIMLSSLAGSLVGLGFIVARKNEWQSRIPFGPYLALGAVLWSIWGAAWWDAYIRWMTGG